MLVSHFEMKELGKLKYFLGVSYYRNDIFISQRKYIFDLLKKIGKNWDARQQGCSLNITTRLEVKKVHLSIKRELIYLSHTRPNIVYVVSTKFEKTLHYLKTNLSKRLLFGREGSLSLEIYTNANYAGSVTDRKFTSYYCLFLGRNLMKIILDNLKVKYEVSIKLFCDNNSTISIAHNTI
ncbi:putative mitochondrial protein, partial [Mucuna pruriens]